MPSRALSASLATSAIGTCYGLAIATCSYVLLTIVACHVSYCHTPIYYNSPIEDAWEEVPRMWYHSPQPDIHIAPRSPISAHTEMLITRP